jgi:GNAT superfamily N-acetyltransferase
VLRRTLMTEPMGSTQSWQPLHPYQMPEVIFMAATSIKLPMAAQSPGRQLHIRPLSPEQLHDLLKMVGRCSPSSLFHRFHGITDGTAYVRHLVATSGHETLTAWSDARCVGVATLARSGCDHELGVLVEDGWQRRGIGTELLARLVASAQASGIDQIVAEVLGEDGYVLSALRRLGSVVVTLEWGVYTARVALRPVLGESGVP